MKEPSQEWIDDCLHWLGKVLTGKKAHWCIEFDFLPIDETCPEFEFCHCDLTFLEENEKDKETDSDSTV